MIRAGPDHPSVCYVQAVAEALPLRQASVDVIWVSTALNHFADINQAVAEFARVLVDDGCVLVRAYVPGRTDIGWAAEFPGRSKWLARYQSLEQLAALFGDHGLALTETVDVLEWTETYAKSAQWVERMRWADSMLTALSEEEIEQGLDALRSKPTKVGRVEVTLLVFGRPKR
jgi:ubiquinone/menaquinone biosynthesis C-methylase UbiE